MLQNLGGEICNKKTASFLDGFGTKIPTAAEYSLFPNGIVERYDAILKDTFRKLNGDQEMDLDQKEVIRRVIFAKTRLIDYLGFFLFVRIYAKGPNV